MAIVQTYQCGHVRVDVDDDEFVGVSREELQKRVDRMLREAAAITTRAELRRSMAMPDKNESA